MGTTFAHFHELRKHLCFNERLKISDNGEVMAAAVSFSMRADNPSDPVAFDVSIGDAVREKLLLMCSRR